MKEVERLKQLRLELGITQEQIAKKLLCSPLTVLRWENGQQFPRRIHQREIQKVLKSLERKLSQNSSSLAGV